MEVKEGLCGTGDAAQPDKEEVQLGKQEVLPSNRLKPGAGQKSDFPGELASFRILEVGAVVTRSQGFWPAPLSEFRLEIISGYHPSVSLVVEKECSV